MWLIELCSIFPTIEKNMVQDQDHDKVTAINPEVDVIELIEKKLPPYVVNSLKAAGFDSVDAICSMDVCERRENSIYVIENYVEQYYSTIKIFLQIQLVVFSLDHSNFHQATECK